MSPFILSLAIKLTALLIVGGMVAVAVRHSTYAVRHIVIAATLACVVALPAAMLLVPEWRVAVLPSDPTTIEEAVVTAVRAKAAATTNAPAARTESIHPVLVTSKIDPDVAPVLGAAIKASARPSLLSRALALPASQIALIVWLIGVIIGLAWIALGRIGLARVRRNATPLTSYEWRTILETEAMHAGVARRVALFTSPSVSMPVTWGVLSPVILLPEAALAWTHDRKRVVVMHEMAHIARRDSATQLVATVACVAYWLHPLVLLAARRLRAECERACDERVLERGTPAAEYAAHLLDVAKFSRSFGAASIVSVAMARPSQLEGRLLAVLRAEPRRARTTARTRVVAAVTAAAMLMIVSAFKPVERAIETRTTVHTSLVSTRVQRDTVDNSAIAPRAPQAARRAAAESIYVKAAPHVEAAVAVAFAAPVAVAAPVAAVATTPNTFATPAPFAVPVDWSTLQVAPVAPVAQVAQIVLRQSRPDSTFRKSVPVKSGGTLDLDLDTGGDINIVGTDDSQVTVDGELGGRDWHDVTVDLISRGDGAALSSRYDGDNESQQFDNAFTIRVPKHFNVRIHSAGGKIAIKGVDGKLTGETGGGRIEIDHASGYANLSTGGGSVHVSNSHLDGSVSTGGGKVEMDDVTGNLASASASSANGNYRYDFRWPDFAKMPALAEMPSLPKVPMMPEIDRVQMKQTMKALARAQRAMELDGQRMKKTESLFDDASDAESESTSEMTRENMERLREEMDRNRALMDSARILIRRNLVGIDTSNIELRRSLLGNDTGVLEYDTPPLKFKEGVIDKSMRELDKSVMKLRDSNDMIVVDKDGGSIRVLRAPKGARLRTGGGSISVGRSDGRVSAMTGGGDIDIAEADDDARATTGSGDITVTAGKGTAHAVDVSSGNGNVDVVIPRGANVTLDLETAYTQNFGRHTQIKGDYELEPTETPDWDATRGTPRKYVRVKQKIGKGGALIRVRTVNGDIRLKEGN